METENFTTTTKEIEKSRLEAKITGLEAKLQELNND